TKDVASVVYIGTSVVGLELEGIQGRHANEHGQVAAGATIVILIEGAHLEVARDVESGIGVVAAAAPALVLVAHRVVLGSARPGHAAGAIGIDGVSTRLAASGKIEPLELIVRVEV